MGRTVTDILTLVSGVSWTLVYLLIIFRSYRDKTYGMPYWALAFNFSLGVDLFLCVEHSFPRPAIAAYHQQNMAGFRSVHFHRLLFVWQAGVAIASSPLPFLSLLNTRVDHKLLLCLPGFGGTGSFTGNVCRLYSEPDDVLAFHCYAQPEKKHRRAICRDRGLQNDWYIDTHSDLWLQIHLRIVFGAGLFYGRPHLPAAADCTAP